MNLVACDLECLGPRLVDLTCLKRWTWGCTCLQEQIRGAPQVGAHLMVQSLAFFFPVEFLASFLEVLTPDKTLTPSVCVAIEPLAKGCVILTMLKGSCTP